MIAAIYSRKSTEQHVADEQKSVARQVAHARQYAATKGWTVDEAHIYVDDGISGAEFTRRPAFMRLMNAVKPRPPFGVLVVSELSRLGREQLETGYAVKQLAEAGVRIYAYLEDREIVLDTALDAFMLAAMNFTAAMEREKATQRARDKARQQVERGHVAGGRCFGYDNVPVLGASGARSHAEPRINEREAAIVRRIFELKAAGMGLTTIGETLNAEGVPTPRPQQGRPAGWGKSSVRAVLVRERYRGEEVWGRTRKRNRWGKKAVSDRPADEWLRRPAPELRIVSEELWRAAHAQMAEAHALYQVATKGLRGGRPCVDSRYLLPGLARCGVCGGGMSVRSMSSGSRTKRRRAFSYQCTSYVNKRHTCPNGARVSMARVDSALIGQLRNLLDADIVSEVLTGVRAEVEAEQQPDTAQARIARELAATHTEIDRLVALAISAEVPAVATRLRSAEARRQALLAEQATLQATVPPPIDWTAVEAAARARLQEWRTLLTQQTQDARTVLRMLLEGRRVAFTPTVEDGVRGVRFVADAGVGGLLEGIVPDSHGSERPHRDVDPGARMRGVLFQITEFIPIAA